MKFVLPSVDGTWEEISITELDDNTVKIDVVPKQMVDDVLKENAFYRNSDKRYTYGKGTQTSMEHLAEISNLQAHELIKQQVFWDDNRLRKWCKDLDNYLWNTRRGKAPTYYPVKHVQDKQANL